VLGFVARRLYAKQVVLLFAVRVPDGDLPTLAGLPELAIGGLDDQANRVFENCGRSRI
jgi:hypothetical protein